MKDKICRICLTSIDMNKEYLEVKHYEKKEKIKSKAYYHIVCFRNRILGANQQTAIAKKAMGILDKVGMRIS